MAATLTDYDEPLSIKVLNVSVYVEPEIEIEDQDNNNTIKNEISMEEKRRLFYEKRLQSITKCLKYLDTQFT